jgi:ABC-type transport system involved in multi-copper enzyme maturation permease subunit
MRELGEMASRRRTYVWRTVFAALLLGLVYWYQLDRLRGYSSPLQLLGSGRGIFEAIIYWLALAVFFGMPLLTCGCIITERERNTLSVLLTTQVSPWSLVIQKLAARLYVMLTLIMVSLPLMALAYSMGGVTVEQISVGVVSIASLSVLTGSFGVLQSVRSASAVGALASTLIWMFVCTIFMGGVLIFGIVGSSVVSAVFSSIGILILSLLILSAAAIRVHQAAIEPPRSRLLIAFRRVDIFFREWNKAFGGIELTRDRASLPSDEPLYWRERYKRALGRTHHLLRIVALLEIPTVLAVSLMVTVGTTRTRNPLSGFVDFLWIIAVLIIAIRTVGVWPLERSRETLDVLLTTPLSGRELVDQTMRGARRTMVAVAVPILTVQLATAMIQPELISAIVYLFGCLLSLTILLPLMAWAAMLISLRVKTQFRATLILALTIAGVVILSTPVYQGLTATLPAFFFWPVMILKLGLDPRSLVHMPNTVLSEDWSPNSLQGLVWCGVVIWYAGLIWILRYRCAADADRLLGRCTPNAVPSSAENPTEGITEC